MKYGLLGERLGHSFSKEIHEQIGSYQYELKEVSKENFDDFMIQKDFIAINVTIPYKEKVIPYLDYIDVSAKKIGAVNTIVNKDNLLYGYNTDYLGFRASLAQWLSITKHHLETKALILGTGGVSKAIQYALDDLGIAYTLVSRRGSEIKTQGATIGKVEKKQLGYDEVDEQVINEHMLIINCTPLGMAPYQDQKPNIPYQLLSAKHLLYDCIYNPEKTLFLQEGEKQGCQIKNGLEMLHQQADEAWRIWERDNEAVEE